MRYCQAVFLLLTFFCADASFAQQNPDTARLEEVPIKAYLSSKPKLVLPTSVSLLGQKELQKQQQTSLINSINTIPGVRMEERSPGSYRFSIRGSLLRSPFGIRNIKMYSGDFPLTDAGGNTYLNLLDPESITSAEILKGPDGSLFGANSGGVVIFHPDTGATRQSINLQMGSYGLFKESAAVHVKGSSFYIPFFQGYQTSNGYRAHSDLSRFYLQTAPQWKYSDKNSIRSFLFYSDLNYQTPGGLTAAQYAADPQQARPSTAAVPGPVAQKAGIRNKTFYGGISHDAQFGRIHHVVSVFG
ncbi:MAG: TonB-dependent receptor plug domain-containing protein, partial [Mucilaginibacter polytrichastri]|nr:TonB-dependent receptor plug domain-containing protein [Mucilaginibacter polytrichastri]